MEASNVPSPPRVIVVTGPEEAAAIACDLVLDAERAAIARGGMFRVVLSGGTTPRRLYERLASCDRADFPHWQVFFGDERWVPADHPDNNARMAHESLLSRVPIPAGQVHPIATNSGTPEKAAELYARRLQRALAPDPAEMPQFDLVLLGLGADGHTASLFPGSSALAAGPRELVVATFAPGPHARRVTLTAPVINAARGVMFLVSGAEKADALARVLDPDPADSPPAALIRPQGALVFVVDEAAASGLAKLPIAIERPHPAR